MKVFVILSLLVALTLAEPPRYRQQYQGERNKYYIARQQQEAESPSEPEAAAPYQPSGWKPAGPSFELPQRQQQQPSTPQNQYGAPQAAPQNQYGAPQAAPQNQYGAPQAAPQNQYEAPQAAPQNQYEAPQAAPQNQYGAPQAAPQQQYRAPQRQEYAAPSAPQNQYGAPQAAPQNQYGAPQAAPQAAPQQQYRAPQRQQYAAPSARQNQYAAPPTPQQQYGPPSATAPQTSYGTPEVTTTEEPTAPDFEDSTNAPGATESQAEPVDSVNELEDEEVDAQQRQSGEYYVALPDGRLQRVQYMSSQDIAAMKYFAKIQAENVEPLRGPIYAYAPLQKLDFAPANLQVAIADPYIGGTPVVAIRENGQNAPNKNTKAAPEKLQQSQKQQQQRQPIAAEVRYETPAAIVGLTGAPAAPVSSSYTTYTANYQVPSNEQRYLISF